MNAEIRSNENNTVVFEIKVDKDQFQGAVDRAYKHMKGRFNIQGFRKGKAPKKIIEAHYGKSVFYEDAIEELFPEVYREAIEALSLEPITKPALEDVENISEDGLTFVVKVGVKPAVKLGDYKGASIPKQDAAATDEEITAKIDEARLQNARLVSVEDTEAQKGDSLNIDFVGKLDGEVFEGGSAVDQIIEIGAGRFIPGFEEQLEGAKTGEERDITVTFPENYAEELAGKEAVFSVTVNEVLHKELPELDDEFVKDISEFDTLDELKEDYAKQISEQKAEEQKNQKEVLVLDYLLDNMELDIPEMMIDEDVQRNIEKLEKDLKQQGLTLDLFLKFSGMDENQFMQTRREDAERNIKLELGLEAIAEAEALAATEEELTEEFAKYAEVYGKTAEEFRADVVDDDLENYIKTVIARRKAVEMLVDAAVVDENA